MSENKKSGQNTPGNELAINYLDKVYETSHKIGSVESRIIAGILTLSLLLVGVSQGVVITNKNFTWSGMGLRMSLPWFIAVGVATITALVVYFWIVERRSQALLNEARRIWTSLNESGAADQRPRIRHLPEDGRDPFRTLDVLSMLDALISYKDVTPQLPVRIVDWIITATLFFGLILLPIVSQIIATWRLISFVGWEQYWAWVPLAVLISISVITPVTSLMDKRNEF